MGYQTEWQKTKGQKMNDTTYLLGHLIASFVIVVLIAFQADHKNNGSN